MSGGWTDGWVGKWIRGWGHGWVDGEDGLNVVHQFLLTMETLQDH